MRSAAWSGTLCGQIKTSVAPISQSCVVKRRVNAPVAIGRQGGRTGEQGESPVHEDGPPTNRLAVNDRQK